MMKTSNNMENCPSMGQYAEQSQDTTIRCTPLPSGAIAKKSDLGNDRMGSLNSKQKMGDENVEMNPIEKDSWLNQ